ERAGVALLAAALRIKDRPVELDAALVHGRDARGRGLEIGIVAKQQCSGHKKKATPKRRGPIVERGPGWSAFDVTGCSASSSPCRACRSTPDACRPCAAPLHPRAAFSLRRAARR